MEIKHLCDPFQRGRIKLTVWEKTGKRMAQWLQMNSLNSFAWEMWAYHQATPKSKTYGEAIDKIIAELEKL